VWSDKRIQIVRASNPGYPDLKSILSNRVNPSLVGFVDMYLAPSSLKFKSNENTYICMHSVYLYVCVHVEEGPVKLLTGLLQFGGKTILIWENCGKVV
jgi:hypothetical protein